MNKKVLRNIIIAVLVLAIAAGGVVLATAGGETLPAPQRAVSIDCTQGFTAAPSRGELRKVSENGRFILYVNVSNGEAAVEDKQNGTTWYTNPEDKSSDGLAAGFHKNALQSVVTLVYTTAQSVDMTCGSFISSVRKDGLSYRLEPDGSVIFLFDFPNECITIPVRYAIEEDRFVAEILTDSVWEYGDNVIKSVDFLPFFGAGGTKDEGYMLVPDGSGALIYYNNNRTAAKSYQKVLYGFDSGISDQLSAGGTVQTLSETQHLPVFGVSRNDQGFLAVITQGAARGAINANVARKYTLYNTVWTTYYHHTIGTAVQTQKDGTQTVTNVPEKRLENYQNFRVEYIFLEKGRNTYSDMAAVYRTHLMERQGLARQESGESYSLCLDLYGYIRKTKSVLGIPVERRIAMTTVEDVNALLDTFEAAGITDVTVKYNYWSKGSYFGKLPVKTGVDGKVGSTKELLALQKRLEGNGGALYLAADLLNVYKTGNGVDGYSGVLRSVSNTAQRQYAFSLGSAAADSRYKSWYLLRPTEIPGVFARYAENLQEDGYHGAALDTVGSKLYSELGSSGVGRNQVLEVVRDAVASTADTVGSLLLTAANDYTAVSASHILEAPWKNSGYDIEDVSVPFYEMVFRGCVSYSLGAVNLSGSPVEMTLRYLECGASPMFSLTSRNTDELIGSRVDHLYSVSASDWTDYVIWQYGLLSEALSPTAGCLMTEHRIVSPDVRAVTYENGVTVYVNYGGEPATVNGVTVEAMGYAVTEDGRLLTGGSAVRQ